MKKLFSMVTVILFVMGLTACTTDLENELADLEQELASLQQQKDTLDGQVDELTEQNLELNDLWEQAELERMDVQIAVTTIDLDGNETTKQIGFSEDFVPSLTDIITLLFDAEIMDSEYGSFLVTLNDMDVPYGSFVSISENGEPSMVGLDDLVVNDDDHFTFEVAWWDTTQQAVYEAIKLFITEQADNYLTTDFIDYNVLLGCQNMCDIPVTEADMKTYLDALTLVTVQDYFKAIMIANTFTDTTYSDGYIEELQAIVSTGPYGQTGLGLIALDSYDHGIDYSPYVTTALSYYDTSSPYQEGLDAGAIGIIGLSNYIEEPSVIDIIDEFVDWIIADQLPSGGIQTRDIVWNDTTYPGTENAATIAQVILALIAIGEDPAGPTFTTDESNLILRLTEFQLADGTFDWDLTDAIVNDPSFSTPQAFLALVTYYHFMNTYGGYTSPYTR
jgi:hypothetical protein